LGAVHPNRIWNPISPGKPLFCRFASRFGQRIRSQRVICIVKLYCFEIFGGILAKCIELRSSNIGKWMLGHGYAPPTKNDFSGFDSGQFLMSLLDTLKPRKDS